MCGISWKGLKTGSKANPLQKETQNEVIKESEKRFSKKVSKEGPKNPKKGQIAEKRSKKVQRKGVKVE